MIPFLDGLLGGALIGWECSLLWRGRPLLMYSMTVAGCLVWGLFLTALRW